MVQTKKQQKNEAFRLLATGKHHQKEIAEIVGVSENTLVRWAVEFKQLTHYDKPETLKLLKERLKGMIEDKTTKTSEIKTMLQIIENEEKALFL